MVGFGSKHTRNHSSTPLDDPSMGYTQRLSLGLQCYLPRRVIRVSALLTESLDLVALRKLFGLGLEKG